MKRKATPGHIVVSKVWPGHPDWEPRDDWPMSQREKDLAQQEAHNRALRLLMDLKHGDNG